MLLDELEWTTPVAALGIATISLMVTEARQEVAPVGVPSRAAMELMAHSLGYDVAWKRRGTCALRPAG